MIRTDRTARTARTARRFAAAAVLLAALPAVLAAQPVPADPRQGGSVADFGETLEVRRINVEVYVTDAEGKRVTDLKAKDFTVLEDGAPVEITNFLAVAGGKAIESASVLPPTRIDTAPDEEPPAAPEAEEIAEDRRLWVVLYIDNLHIRPFNRNKVLGHVRSFLRTLEQGTQVMLVSFDRSLHVRESFTDDREMIGERTFELENLTGSLVEKQTSRDITMKEIQGTTKDSILAASQAEFYAQNAYNDIEQSTRGLDDTIEQLAGLPGRKALVYISDGLEMRAGEDLFQLVQSQYGKDRERSSIGLSAGRFNARRLFSQLVARANSSGVTVYTIDAAGLKAGGTNADRGGGGSTFEVDVTYQLNRQEPLIYMSDETGGLSAIGTSNFGRAFENIGQDFTHYYSLAYNPRHGGDGRQHEIEVKVARKGLNVRFRDGYRDKSNEVKVAESTIAALLYGTGQNPLGVDAKLMDLVGSDTGPLLPIDVRIPIGKITLVPRGELQYGRLRVALAMLDSDGNRSPIEQREVPIEIPTADLEVALTKYYVYEAKLRVGKGDQRIVITVRDELSGLESIVRKAVTFSP